MRQKPGTRSDQEVPPPAGAAAAKPYVDLFVCVPPSPGLGDDADDDPGA